MAVLTEFNGLKPSIPSLSQCKGELQSYYGELNLYGSGRT
jgi:hypothetical protein